MYDLVRQGRKFMMRPIIHIVRSFINFAGRNLFFNATKPFYFNLLSAEMKSSLLEEQYIGLLNRYNGPGKKVITSFHGQMDEERISVLTYTAEHQLDKEGARRGSVKKIFNILIEMLQNILLHGKVTEEVGNPFSLVIAQNVDEYELSCTNLVETELATKIANSLDELKKMNEKQLKTHYLEVLGNEQYSVKGGAGLGLITIALKCNNQFTFSSTPLNDKLSLFTITAVIFDK